MIIGICGPDGVGKSTTGRAMRAALVARCRGLPGSYRTVKLRSIADPIYEMLCAMLDVTRDQLKQYKNSTVGHMMDCCGMRVAPLCIRDLTIRQLLQRVGTEAMRNGLDQNIWVDIAASRAVEDSHTIFDDIRFPNEAKICNWIVELQRDGVQYAGEHISNAGLPRELITHTYQLSKTVHEEISAKCILEMLFPWGAGL